MLGCFSTNKERSWSRKKPSVLRELIPLVKSYCILFLSDAFEDGSILNYNNLTHAACSALCIAVWYFYLIDCWPEYSICVYICMCKLQTKAGDFLNPFLVFSCSICKNWTNDMMFAGVLHGVAVREHSALQLRELSWPLWYVPLICGQLANRGDMLKLPFAQLAVQRGTLDGTWSSTGFWKCSRVVKNLYSRLLLFVVESPWSTG